MSPESVGLLSIAVLLVLLFMGVNVAVAMFLVALVGLSLVAGFAPAVRLLASVQFSQLANFTLIVIPLFLLMSAFASRGAVGTQVFDAAKLWLGKLPGGVALAAIAACAGFAAASGSSAATCAAVGRVTIPQMQRLGYSYRLAAGCVGAAGTLGFMIPPSVSLVIFGMLTDVSVGKLLIGGILPGLTIAFTFMLLVFIWALVKPSEAPRDNETVSWGLRIRSLKYVLPLLALMVAVMGSIYLGIATPTEAAAVGALVALFIALRMGMSAREALSCSTEAARTTSMIVVIVVAAMFLSQLVARTRLPFAFGEWVALNHLGPWQLIGVLTLVYLVLGMFMEGISMQLLTVPIVFNSVLEAGLDPIWFGIYVTLMVGIAQITPPVGMNLYVLHGITPERPLADVIKAVVPFFFVLVANIVLLLIFPAIATYLPNLMSL